LAKYDDVWKELKRTGKVEILVSKEAAPTILNGIKRTKAEENSIRKGRGLIRFSKLEIIQEPVDDMPTHIRIKLSFVYSILV